MRRLRPASADLSPRRPGDDRARRAVPGLLLLIACLLPIGCRNDNLNSTYGQRRGGAGGKSVNGTGVLAEMFEQAGYRVTSWSRLSPRLEDFDVIVWAPDSFEPPSKEEREFLEGWLGNEPNRTLVYIGRDYDAEIDYWNKILPQAPPDQAMEVNRRLAQARARHAQARAKMPEEEYARWFVVRRGEGQRQIQELESPGVNSTDRKDGAGRIDWVSGVDASRAEIVIQGRLDPPRRRDVSKSKASDVPDADVLLASGDDPLVTRVRELRWRGSQILVVANGSFLLNLPLVNHEHRKLAARLIEACGDREEAAFLESGPEGLATYDQEPKASYPTGAEVFTVWPLGVIALHLVALGIVFCFAEFPIFGRSKSRFEPNTPGAAAGAIVGVLDIVIVRHQESPRGPSDFGSHIGALGSLLQRTGDVSYAQARLRHYQQHVRHDSSSPAAAESRPSASQPTGSVPHE